MNMFQGRWGEAKRKRGCYIVELVAAWPYPWERERMWASNFDWGGFVIWINTTGGPQA